LGWLGAKLASQGEKLDGFEDAGVECPSRQQLVSWFRTGSIQGQADAVVVGRLEPRMYQSMDSNNWMRTCEDQGRPRERREECIVYWSRIVGVPRYNQALGTSDNCH